jgi:hypothetical protein
VEVFVENPTSILASNFSNFAEILLLIEAGKIIAKKDLTRRAICPRRDRFRAKKFPPDANQRSGG